MLLHYLGKLKNQIFCRYSADREENANKLHYKCTDEYPSSVISYRQSHVGPRLVLLTQDKLINRLNFLVHGQVTIIFVVSVYLSVCLSVCLFVCADFFSAVFDPIWIKLGHMLRVRV